MAQFIPKHNYTGAHHLSSPVTTTCTDADIYYKIAGTWTDGDNCNNGFEYDGNGKITYIGESGAIVMFTGVSDLESSKVAKVTYGLYKNGALSPNNQTPRDFEHANSLGNISITNCIKVNKFDYFEVYVKSDTASTNVTTDTLFITFMGDR